MLAQLLGMGRKKDPPKGNSYGEKQQSETASNGASPNTSKTHAASTGQGVTDARAPVEAGIQTLPSPAVASACHTANGCAGAGAIAQSPAAATAAITANGQSATGRCMGCANGSGMATGDAAGAVAAAGSARAGGGDGAVVLVAAGGKSLTPSPPPAGPGTTQSFASPAMAATMTAVAHHQPPGQKVFSTEAAAVERGLHLQLGDTGAKTESQLGGQQLEAAKRLRELLETHRERMVQELLSRGWVPLLLRWLGLVHRPSLQVEALSALTTVAQTTTEHTPLLVKHGAIATLVSLLKSPSLEMVEQAMWVLGKMAQDGQDGTTTARDAVLQAGVLGPLVRCLEQHQNLLSLQRIGAWSLFNLLDGQPRPTVDVLTVNTVMPAINRLLMAGESEVLSHACSALSYLCDGSAAHIKIVVESGVCRRLVQLLDHPSSQVVKPALRTIGNVVCAEDDADYTEAILEAGSVACLKKLIAHPNREIQKEACWTLSNIAAGSVSQIQSVLDSGAMPQLIKLATEADTESEVRSEAFWVVLNAASCGSDAQIEYLVSQGCVQILSDLLGESSMVMMALEGIERVLSVGDLRVVRNAIASHSHGDQGSGGGGDDGSGGQGHCVECASAAAVAAAAAAAAARDGQDGGGNGLRLGLGGDEANKCPNPYACMLTPEKIQALEGHKNSAVAKRANRVWARYFVTCAICRGSFSRHGSSASFCAECNCHVCGTCDCSVFHLAYQDKLWEEMEGKEKRGKKAQQAAKKNKKAKKREKKKNAAKELAVEPEPEPEPLSKGRKARGGDKDGAGGVKRANGGGKEKGSGKHSGDLGKKALNRRSESPNKASSSASTESNSEDEYDPSFPQTKLDATARAPATSAATASAATTAAAAAAAAATASAAKKDGTAAPANSPPPKMSAAGRPPAVVKPLAPDAAASSTAEDERGQRRAGKKQRRRDQMQQQPAPAQQQHSGNSSSSALSSSSSSSSSASSPFASSSASPASATVTNTTAAAPAAAAGKIAAAVGRVADDGGEQPWVVVGGSGGKRSGATKWNKGQQQQKAAAAAVPAGGGGSTSSVVWASESSPASVAVRAETSARPKAAVATTATATAPATVVVPRASPKPFAAEVVSPGGGGDGAVESAWGGAATLTPPAVPLTNASRRTYNTANGREIAPHPPHRPVPEPGLVPVLGPGPGSVWGTSAAPVVDAGSKPFFVAAAGSDGVSLAAPRADFGGVATSQAACPTNRAGVIGPRPAAKPLGPAGPPSPPTKVPRLPAPALPFVETKGGPGVVGVVTGSGSSVGGGKSAVFAPPVSRPAINGGGASNIGLVRTASSGSEALVENEKLVSFLLETGSILALAQRLEEEDDWRRPAPSPIKSRPG